jgi:RNA polymerase sigma factor for flagellar operon FliA
VSREDLYSTHAESIDAVIKAVCRRHRLTPDRADDLASRAQLKLIENNYAVLRQFQGRSSIRTYLVTVVERVLLDWRVGEWGKWRPCQEARRLGAVAIDLDRLLTRDGIPYEEAVEMLLAQGRAASRAELDDIRPKLTDRTGRQMVSGEALEHMPARGAAADERVVAAERATQTAKAGTALAEALRALPPSDQVILRLRFQDGFTVARIAALVGEEQKPLYRRFERLFAQLRAAMGQAGLTEDERARSFTTTSSRSSATSTSASAASGGTAKSTTHGPSSSSSSAPCSQACS